MDLSPDETGTWLKAVIALLLAAWAWTMNRLVKQLDGQKIEIAKIKDDLALKASLSDMSAVYARITLVDERVGDRLVVLSDRMNEQHVEVLEAVNEKHKEILTAIYTKGV